MDKGALEGLSEVKKIFENEGRFLQIPATKGKLLVVGDLHGDGRTLDLVLDRFFYSREDTIIVFLGDYVDREPSSWAHRQTAVIVKLLQLKVQCPQRVFLLMGNHDLDPDLFTGFHTTFWWDLNRVEHEFFSDALSALPVVATTSNGVCFCHGVLPLDTNFKGFDLTKRKWLDVLWADYCQDKKKSRLTMRPSRFRVDFNKSMEAFGVNLLIKGHNPICPLRMYDNRCVTLQTNRHYQNICGINIALIDLARPVNTGDDIEILTL